MTPRWSPLPLVAASLLGGCQSVGSGAAPASTQRPTFSSDTATTAEGTLEMEAGTRVDPHDVILTPLSLKYGAGASTEAFVSWSPYTRLYRPGTEARGASDVVVGTRYRFLEADGAAPSAAVQGAVKVPTASESDGLGNGEYDFAVAGILTGAAEGWSWTTYYELGLLGEVDGAGHDTAHALALAAGTHVAEHLSAFGEVAGISVRARSENPVFTTWGLAWSTDPSVIWDAGITLGLNDDAPDAQFVVGVTCNFGRLRRREAPAH